MLVTVNVRVPGVRGFGAGLTSAILPLTTEPPGISTSPEAVVTSSTPLALKGSPGLAVCDEIVSVAAISNRAPGARRSVARAGVFGRPAAAGGAGGGAGRRAGGSVRGGAAGFAAG